MKVKKRKTQTKKNSAETAIFQLNFNKEHFKTEKSVKTWLAENQITGYTITDSDKDGEYIVKSKTVNEDHLADCKEIMLDGDFVSAFVGEVNATTRKSAITADEDAPKDKPEDGDDADAGQEGNSSDDDGSDDDAGDDTSDDDDDTSDDDQSGDDEDSGGDDAEDTSEDDDDAGDDEGADDQSDDDDDAGNDDEGDSADDDQDDEDEPKAKRGPFFEPGDDGDRFAQNVKRMRAKGHIVKSVDRFVKKYDGYAAYISGSDTLKGVLSDGLTSDGVPPGMSEVFSAIYRSISNTLKSSKQVEKDVTVIGSELVDTVVALHETWKKLLKDGTPAQKSAAKKYFKAVEAAAAQEDFANTRKSTEDDIDDRVAKAVAKAVAPLNEQITKANAELAKVKKGVRTRKSFGTDDSNLTSSKVRMSKEEEEDEAWIAERSQKGLLGAFS